MSEARDVDIQPGRGNRDLQCIQIYHVVNKILSQHVSKSMLLSLASQRISHHCGSLMKVVHDSGLTFSISKVIASGKVES